MTKKSLNIFTRTIMILLICGVYLLWGTYFIYRWKSSGTVISVKNASSDIPGILAQNLIVAVIPIVIFLITFLVLRDRFAEEMFLKINGRKQKIALLIIAMILLAMTVFCLVTKEDKGSVLHGLIYYLVFVAFAEEFVVRDVCVYLLNGERNVIRYIVPNVIFAVMHIFSYAQWGTITASHIVSFATSNLIGLVVTGCFFQFLKDKSKTIWIPVLVHAILDYSAVLSYN